MAAKPEEAEDRHQLAIELDELTESLERLKINFERYFMGLEKLPPLTERDKLKRRMRKSPLHKVKRTAARFRFQNLMQRLGSYNTYWERILRQIEEGTFRREQRYPGSPAALKAQRAREVAAKAEQTPAAGDPLQPLYKEWCQARADLGANGRVGFDKFAAKMRAMRAKHVQQFGCDDVEYRVKVKDGRVSFVARPLQQR